MDKIRIGIDGHMIGDHSGGNESYYRNILLSMDPVPGAEFYLFLKPGVDARVFEERFNIVRFRSSNAAIRNFIELPILAGRLKLDVLHTQYFIPFIRPCPVVCTIHDICFEHYDDIFTRSEYIRQKLLIPYAARKSKAIFTVSEFSKRDISEKYGIPPERITVTCNAVDDSFCRLDEGALDESRLRSKFGIGDAPFILTVGNLQPRKNLPRLIEAFKKMKFQPCPGGSVQYGNEKRHKLVIVGKKAWKYDEILKSVNDDRIILTDYVTETDLIRLYNAAEVFVYPSFFEGFGLPPLEAMVCGTPVIVSKTTALPEVVGDAGFYFDPFDVESIKYAMECVIADKSLQEDMIRRGFQQIKQFSWKHSAKLIVDTYRNVLKETHGDRTTR